MGGLRGELSEKWRSLGAAIGLALLTAACASAGASAPPTAVVEPSGALDDAEKARADMTVLQAAAAGESRRWDAGRPGYYGLVEPGPAEPSTDGGVCRVYSHTIFIDGLARQEKGRACRPRGGVWRIAPDAA